MKKILILWMLLLVTCMPLLASCSKKPACEDCYRETNSHVTLSFGMKDGETKTYDLSKENVKIYLEFHVTDRLNYNPYKDIYGKNIVENYAIVADYNKIKDEIPTPIILPIEVKGDDVAEMPLRDTYYKKVKGKYGFFSKWYQQEHEVQNSSSYFEEGEHFFFVSTNQSWYNKYNFRSYYYKREGDKLTIRKQTENEDWCECNFDKEDEKAFWENYTPGYGGF